MQKIALDILETCNTEIRDRLSNIQKRISQRQPGFRSRPLDKDFLRFNTNIVVEELPMEEDPEDEQYSIRIHTETSNKESSDHEKSCSSLLNVLRETDAKSRRLRNNIKQIVKKIGCSDESKSIGSYIIKLVPTLNDTRINQIKPDFKSPRSHRIHRHQRTNSDQKQFAFPSNTLHIPETSIYDKYDQLDGTHILDSERLIQKDEPEEQNFLSRSDLADSAGSLSFIHNISNVSRKQLEIQSANEYTNQYILKLKDRLNSKQIPKKIKAATFQKFIKQMQKRAQLSTVISFQDQQVRESPRKKSFHNIQSTLDVQYTVRDKALRKMLEMRDNRYK